MARINNYKIIICEDCGESKSVWISSIGKFCSRNCLNNNKYKTYVKLWLEGKVDGRKGIGYGAVSNYIRRYIIEKFNNKCCMCGWSEINRFTNTTPLEIDHIDGNSENNKEENLRLICPNCHSLTETHSTSKKNGRRYYRNLYNKQNMGSSGDG